MLIYQRLNPIKFHLITINHHFPMVFFPGLNHIFSTSLMSSENGEIHPVFALAPQWPRSSLPKASGESWPWKENSEVGEWEFIQRYRGIIFYIIYYIILSYIILYYIILYYIILYYICVNMCIYIYMVTHTHARAEPPPGSIEISSLVNIVCLAPSSASPHRHWKPKTGHPKREFLRWFFRMCLTWGCGEPRICVFVRFVHCYIKMSCF